MTSKLRWLLNRLQRMSVQEVIFRTCRACLQFVEKIGVNQFGRSPNYEWHPSEMQLFDELPELSSEIDPSVLDAINSLQNGRIDFFGNDFLDTGADKNWHRDPKTGIEAPKTYGKSIDYRDDKLVGNIKYLWEWGRHQHLVPLAIHYFAQRDEQVLDAISKDINSWIEQNPYCIGVHWCSSLEAALRLSSWAVVHGLLRQCGYSQGLFDCVDKPDVLKQSIYQQTYFIRNFLSLHSSANNHLIGELTGLWASCKVFGLGEQGEQWADFAQSMLEQQATLQVHPDGVNKEQAIYYHLWVMEYFLFCWLLGERSGQRFSADFQKTILSMALFLRDLMPEAGFPPQIGDADDGTVVRFNAVITENPYLDCLLAIEKTMSVDFLLGDVDRKNAKSLWYGCIFTASHNTPRVYERGNGSNIWRDGGYAVLKGKSATICFDAGQLGYTSIAAHGHADALSVNIAVGSEWWIIDPGTYAYHSGQQWRDYFRSTLAHNTIRLGGTDQSDIAGPFMWSRQANAQIEGIDADTTDQIVSGGHDGYKPLGWVHRRELRFCSATDYLEVSDTLEGSGNTYLQLLLHFAPDLDLNFESEHRLVVSKNNHKKRLEIAFDPRLEVGIHRGQTQPIIGWYSSKLDEKEPTSTLVASMTITGPVTLLTSIAICEVNKSNEAG